MKIHKTAEGERLDDIVFDEYGATSGYLEAVLGANRHLAEYGIVLPADVKIALPPFLPKMTKPKTSLWD